MLETSVAELAATGALVIFWFQGLSAGKRLLPSSVGTIRSSRSSSCSRTGRRVLALPGGVWAARRIRVNHLVVCMMVLPSATALLPIPRDGARERCEPLSATELKGEIVSDAKL